MVIARTHSLIARETMSKLQERINMYQAAGADILCIHYTDNDWEWYIKTVGALNITKPLLLILSNFNFVPTSSHFFDYVLFPNQIYRMMLHALPHRAEQRKGSLSFDKNKVVETKTVFGLIDSINES